LASAPMRKPPAFFFDVVEARYRFEIDHVVRLGDVIFHQLQKLVAAADHRRALFLLMKFLQQADCFSDALGIDVFKTFHGRVLLA
jgi:hypothetical protein